MLEIAKNCLGAMLDLFVDRIEASEDVTKGNQPRTIRHLLIVEEIADAWTSDQAEQRAQRLLRLLDKTWRKGWSIWLSTQRPSSLGPSESTSRALLGLLKTRVVHAVDNESDQAALLTTFRGEGHAEEDIEYIRQQLPVSDEKGVKKGRAVVRGASKDGKILPPVLVNILMIGNAGIGVSPP